MKKSNCYAVVSGKGGTGKTTVCAALASALSILSRKVCVVDLDVGLHNLDLALGLQDQVLFDLGDVLAGRISLDEALLTRDDLPNLAMLAAPADYEFLGDPDRFSALVAELCGRFDYCLIENLDDANSITGGDVFSFAKRCGCQACGIAHTDLFAHIERLGADPLDYFKRMAEEHIFWEMNVSYDQIHNYREHAYVKRFLVDEAQQEIVRKSGARLSVGFDGHRVGDYRPDRVVDCCNTLQTLGLPLVFEV